jgi:hypothetical protein
MDIKQEFREEKNMDVYAMNVNDGSFSNVYVKWLEAKINYTRCCETLKVKETMSFEDWVKDNGYQSTIKGFTRQGLKFTFNQIHSKYIVSQQSL